MFADLLRSNYISDVKFFLGIKGQLSANVRQLVFEGLATTNIFDVALAYWFNS